MVLEVVDIQIQPGQQAAFTAAVARGVDEAIKGSPGYLGYCLHSGLESPERFLLFIQWERLEAHTVEFRQSPRFAQWRSIVGPFFAQPPVVEHFIDREASGSRRFAGLSSPAT